MVFPPAKARVGAWGSPARPHAQVADTSGRVFLTFGGVSDTVQACGDGTRIVLRLIFRFFGFIFSWVAIGSIMALAALAAIFTIYGKDLPGYAQLEVY